MASKRTVEPIAAEHQAGAILGAFATWLAGGPDRRVIQSKDAKGWRVDLDEQRTTRGRTLEDTSTISTALSTRFGAACSTTLMRSAG
jgi:hypothetical protein